VIISDNFHPARCGSGALYTVEHFAAIRTRLASDGIFCQWLPLHQLDLPTLRSIVKSYMQVFPAGAAILASNSLETPVLGLVARADDARFDRRRVRDRLAMAAWSQSPAAFGIEDEFALLGSFVAGPSSLNRFVGDADANTDDHPVVSYAAPRATYSPTSRPKDRLLELIGEFHIAPGEVIDFGNDAVVASRHAAYRLARDHFLAAGRDVRRANNAAEMLAQVQEPLLAVLRISPDFRPAYNPLLGLATALARTEPGAAQSLLAKLDRIRASGQPVESALP
jgi:spermidine synthase